MPHESTVDHNVEYDNVAESPMATRNLPPKLDHEMKEKHADLPSQQMARSTEITHTHDEDDDDESDD